MAPNIHPYGDLSRRGFVTRAAQSFLGVSLIPTMPLFAASASAARAKRVIYLYMSGGMSHLDTFDPKPGTQAQGATESIKTNVPGTHIADSFKGISHQMDKIAVIRSMTTKQGAHERGQYAMRSGYAPSGTIVHPGVGPWVERLKGRGNPSLPGNVLIGQAAQHPGSGFLGSKYAPIPIRDAKEGLSNSTRQPGVGAEDLERQLKLAAGFDADFRRRYPHEKVRAYGDYYADAVRLMKSDDLEAFDITKEPVTTRQAYGDHAFGRGVLLARRLIQYDVRFVEVCFGGWDTHADHFEAMPELTGPLDQGLSFLLTDLERLGLLDETLVVVATEFGRTPEINGAEGRDHHPRVFTCLLAGGGVRGGTVYGSSDRVGYQVETDGVSVADFNATIGHALGIAADQSITTPSGRPMAFSDHGQPIRSLFA